MITLHRVTYTDKGTFGVLLDENHYPMCVTCEDPWHHNQTSVSCIPEGTYSVVPHNSSKYPNVWRLESVPDREGILIHWGNTIKDTSGCILVGMRFGIIGGLPAVLQSRDEINILREKLPSNFTLTIRS